MTDNDFNPVVEIQAEVEVTPTLQLQAEVDMGSLASERNAEAWAVGQRGGVDVSSTDQTYHNNAKYWAEQAEASATGDIIDDTSTALNKVWSAHKVSGEFADTNGEVTDLKSAKAPVVMEAISTPADVQTFSDGADNLPVKTLTVGIDPVQEGSGDPSPENVRPITGHTGANVYRTGKNLFGGSELKSKLQTITGATTGTDTVGDYVTFAGSSAMSGIPLFDKFKANTQYTAILKYKKNNTNTASNIAFLYSDGTFGYINSQETAAEGALYTAVITSTSGKTITDIRAIYASGDTTVYYNLCGVFEGVLTADQFAPYTGNTYHITFPEAAGTVYGGTLTIHQDGSGELVVDRAEVDLGTLDWTYVQSFDLYNAGTGDMADNKPFVCSIYKYVGSFSNLVDKSCSNVYNNKIAVRDSSYADATAFKTAMSGVQLCYKLATHVTYQLTNQQVIELLNGNNNIWADTGKINAVDYPADTKLYIDKKIAEIQALILENISNS